VFQVFREHVAEERALADGVVESDVGVGEIVEPAGGHVAFHRVAVGRVHERHRVGFDVQGRVGEGRLAGEADEVPVDEEEIESDGIGNEDRFAGEGFDPGEVARHDDFGGLGVFAAGVPGVFVLGPEIHGARVAGGAGESSEVGGEGAEDFFVGGHGEMIIVNGAWVGRTKKNWRRLLIRKIPNFCLTVDKLSIIYADRFRSFKLGSQA
jgi:hypothetical protein